MSSKKTLWGCKVTISGNGVQKKDFQKFLQEINMVPDVISCKKDERGNVKTATLLYFHEKRRDQCVKTINKAETGKSKFHAVRLNHIPAKIGWRSDFDITQEVVLNYCKYFGFLCGFRWHGAVNEALVFYITKKSAYNLKQSHRDRCSPPGHEFFHSNIRFISGDPSFSSFTKNHRRLMRQKEEEAYFPSYVKKRLETKEKSRQDESQESRSQKNGYETNDIVEEYDGTSIPEAKDPDLIALLHFPCSSRSSGPLSGELSECLKQIGFDVAIEVRHVHEEPTVKSHKKGWKKPSYSEVYFRVSTLMQKMSIGRVLCRFREASMHFPALGEDSMEKIEFVSFTHFTKRRGTIHQKNKKMMYTKEKTKKKALHVLKRKKEIEEDHEDDERLQIVEESYIPRKERRRYVEEEEEEEEDDDDDDEFPSDEEEKETGKSEKEKSDDDVFGNCYKVVEENVEDLSVKHRREKKTESSEEEEEEDDDDDDDFWDDASEKEEKHTKSSRRSVGKEAKRKKESSSLDEEETEEDDENDDEYFAGLGLGGDEEKDDEQSGSSSEDVEKENKKEDEKKKREVEISKKKLVDKGEEEDYLDKKKNEDEERNSNSEKDNESDDDDDDFWDDAEDDNDEDEESEGDAKKSEEEGKNQEVPQENEVIISEDEEKPSVDENVRNSKLSKPKEEGEMKYETFEDVDEKRRQELFASTSSENSEEVSKQEDELSESPETPEVPKQKEERKYEMYVDEQGKKMEKSTSSCPKDEETFEIFDGEEESGEEKERESVNAIDDNYEVMHNVDVENETESFGRSSSIGEKVLKELGELLDMDEEETKGYKSKPELKEEEETFQEEEEHQISSHSEEEPQEEEDNKKEEDSNDSEIEREKENLEKRIEVMKEEMEDVNLVDADEPEERIVYPLDQMYDLREKVQNSTIVDGSIPEEAAQSISQQQLNKRFEGVVKQEKNFARGDKEDTLPVKNVDENLEPLGKEKENKNFFDVDDEERIEKVEELTIPQEKIQLIQKEIVDIEEPIPQEEIEDIIEEAETEEEEDPNEIREDELFEDDEPTIIPQETEVEEDKIEEKEESIEENFQEEKSEDEELDELDGLIGSIVEDNSWKNTESQTESEDETPYSSIFREKKKKRGKKTHSLRIPDNIESLSDDEEELNGFYQTSKEYLQDLKAYYLQKISVLDEELLTLDIRQKKALRKLARKNKARLIKSRSERKQRKTQQHVGRIKKSSVTDLKVLTFVKNRKRSKNFLMGNKTRSSRRKKRQS